MNSPETFPHKGYDSVSIKPDLGDYYLVPEISWWIHDKRVNRFDIINVQSAIREISLEFDEEKIKNNDDTTETNKHGLCVATYNNLLNYGRKAAIYPLLEGLKVHALADVIKNEESRTELLRSRYSKRTIEKLVVRQVIQYFFDDMDKPAKDKNNNETGGSFSLN